MNGNIVFDSSAALALLKFEPGCDVVLLHLSSAVMSTVNLAETVTILVEQGMPQNLAEKTVEEVFPNTISFEKEHAFVTANLKQQNKKYGLSLGDRACLALSQIQNLPVITGDRIWEQINHSTQIIFFR